MLKTYFAKLTEAERAEQLDEIESAVRRMKGLIDEVLLLGRVESGRMECRPAPLDLAALARRILGEVSAATQNACPIELTAAEGAGPVTLDESLTAILLNNLLSNAVKYSPSGAPVQLALRRELGEVVLEVRDTGMGIPAADQADLFKSFHRGSNVENIAGTGLGLTIVKRCVDLHGGVVSFVSQEGRGTAFTVRLPA